MIEHDIPQWWVVELLQVLILPILFSSVFSKQAPSSDLPLKHVDTMVSVLLFQPFFGEKDANGGLNISMWDSPPPSIRLQLFI